MATTQSRSFVRSPVSRSGRASERRRTRKSSPAKRRGNVHDRSRKDWWHACCWNQKCRGSRCNRASNGEQDFCCQQHECSPPALRAKIMEFSKGAQHSRAARKRRYGRDRRDDLQVNSRISHKPMLLPSTVTDTSRAETQKRPLSGGLSTFALSLLVSHRLRTRRRPTVT